jgi:hypothetical protein
MMLLPPGPDVCPICAVKHETNQAHDCQSLYYQYRFYGVRHRWPTWADAVAHCTPELRAAWERELRKVGVWSEPPNGELPIADPPEESYWQAIGDPNSHTFGE